MDRLTSNKKQLLINDCRADAISNYKLTNKTIYNMYMFLADQTEKAITSDRIELLNGVKASLDYLVDGVKRNG